MAILLQVMCNVHRDDKARPYPFELDEVMSWLGFPPDAPDAPPPPAPATPDELRQKLELLSTLYPKSNGQQAEGQA